MHYLRGALAFPHPFTPSLFFQFLPPPIFAHFTTWLKRIDDTVTDKRAKCVLSNNAPERQKESENVIGEVNGMRPVRGFTS